MGLLLLGILLGIIGTLATISLSPAATQWVIDKILNKK
jgi:hypothetical protein